jgi:hypothetical protein
MKRGQRSEVRGQKKAKPPIRFAPPLPIYGQEYELVVNRPVLYSRPFACLAGKKSGGRA